MAKRLFSEDWLKCHSNILLDPDLYAFSGRQYINITKGKSIFRMLSDVCSDRWGRRLIQRKEEILSLMEKQSPLHLYEMDYLTAVNDFLRTGGLRFKLSPESEFTEEYDGLDISPITELSRLEQASLNYEFSDDTYETKWLSRVVSPGSSLGGTRPKANIVDKDGNLWIAKLKKFSDYGSTFIVKRFDRKGKKRVHFASSMTMLGAVDGSSEQYSYLDIAEFISSYGKNPVKYLEELYRRIAFNIAVSNHDDHLRKHGFLLNSNNWVLSPVYDINPSPDNSQYLSIYII